MEKFIEKVGLDRIAHFGVGAAVCAFLTLMFIFSLPVGGGLEFSWWLAAGAPILGYVAVALLAWAKEMNDDTPDWRDFLASMLGCVFVHLGAVIGWLLHFGNGRDLITTWWGWAIFAAAFAALAFLWVRWVVRGRRKRTEGGK